MYLLYFKSILYTGPEVTGRDKLDKLLIIQGEQNYWDPQNYHRALLGGGRKLSSWLAPSLLLKTAAQSLKLPACLFDGLAGICQEMCKLQLVGTREKYRN